jgi:hypothetical protein
MGSLIQEAIEGIADWVRDSDIDWCLAQILAGATLIGIAAVWYVIRRNVEAVVEPMEYSQADLK